MERTCTECGLAAARVRKGRCDACYMRQYRKPEVEGGAVCAVCGERRRALLDSARVGGDAVTLCGNCALVLARSRPRLDSLGSLKERLARKGGPERRAARGAASASVAVRVMPSFDPSVD